MRKQEKDEKKAIMQMLIAIMHGVVNGWGME